MAYQVAHTTLAMVARCIEVLKHIVLKPVLHQVLVVNRCLAPESLLHSRYLFNVSLFIRIEGTGVNGLAYVSVSLVKQVRLVEPLF